MRCWVRTWNVVLPRQNETVHDRCESLFLVAWVQVSVLLASALRPMRSPGLTVGFAATQPLCPVRYLHQAWWREPTATPPLAYQAPWHWVRTPSSLLCLRPCQCYPRAGRGALHSAVSASYLSSSLSLLRCVSSHLSPLCRFAVLPLAG